MAKSSCAADPQRARCARTHKAANTLAIAAGGEVSVALRRLLALIPCHAICPACLTHDTRSQLLGGLIPSDLARRCGENLKRQPDAVILLTSFAQQLGRFGALGEEHLRPEVADRQMDAHVRPVNDADGVGVAPVHGHGTEHQ